MVRVDDFAIGKMMGFFETPIRRLCLVRAAGCFVLAVALAGLSFTRDVDNWGRYFCHAAAGVCLGGMVLNIWRARRTPVQATLSAIPDFRRLARELSKDKVPDTPEELVDPSLGRYVTGPGDGSWRCRPHDTFLLRGRSKHPTPEQISVWREAEVRLPELVERAIASIPPPAAHDPANTFDRAGCKLDEIRLEQDGSVVFFFGPSILVDGYELYPMIVFRDWKITESHWTP